MFLEEVVKGVQQHIPIFGTSTHHCWLLYHSGQWLIPNSHTDGTSDECVTHSSLPSCVPQVTIPPYLTQGEASNTKHLKEKAGPAIFTDGQDIKIIVCAFVVVHSVHPSSLSVSLCN